MRPSPGRGWGAPAAPLVWGGERPGPRGRPAPSVGPAPGIGRAPASLGAAGGAGPGPGWPSLRSGRWQVCGGQNFAGAPGSSLWPAAPLDSLCHHYCPLPLGAPGGAGGVRAGGETETWFREKAAGGAGGGGSGKREISVKGKAGSPEMLCPGEPRDTPDPEEVVQVFTEGRARGGAGKNRDGGAPGENRGGRRAGAGARSGGRLPRAPRAAGRTRRLLARGPRPRRPRGTRAAGG